MKDFLTRDRSVKACSALLLMTLAVTPGCSTIAQPAEGAVSTDPGPTYAKVVADYMRTTFKDLPPAGAAEISQPRWVQSQMGSNWLACVHFQDHSGRRRTYSVFFNQGTVVDARYAVLTDACSAQSYWPLDLSGGMQRPGALGDNGPLY